MKKQNGFTLIEISLVIIIIGILLGGALKGQHLIESAKTKRTLQDIAILKMAYQSYIEKYRVLPGDNPRAAVLHQISTLSSGNGNGELQGNFNATNNDETQLLWQHLRAAGLYQGDDTGGAMSLQLPTHAWGGVIGFASDNYGMSGAGICLQNIPAEHAITMDIQQDDGVINSGSIRAGTSVLTNTASEAYELDKQYHVCFDM